MIVVGLLALQVVTVVRAHTRQTTTKPALAAFLAGSESSALGVDGKRASIRYFRDAIRLDTRFAEARYALADTYLDLVGAKELPPAPALAEARAEAEEALRLEELPATRHLVGVLDLVAGWDWQGAGKELAAAVRLAPDWDAALVSYARFLSGAGRHSKAIEVIDRAETLNPTCDLLLVESAVIRYRAGRDAEALEKLSLAKKYGPPRSMDNIAWNSMLKSLALFVHVHQQQWSAAAEDASAIEALRGGPMNPFVSSDDPVHFVEHFLRQSAAMTARDAGTRTPLVSIASMYAATHDDDEALAWLERALDARDTEIVYSLHNPEFDHIRNDVRFQRISARLRLPG
jgi:tetratricopeptide (TPR) repeat protein